MRKITTTTFKTPVGEMIAGAVDEGLCFFDFRHRRMIENIFSRVKTNFDAALSEGEHPHFLLLKEQLKDYFEGQRKEFQLPLLFSGTPFQKKVWEELLRIPYGNIRSYKQQALAMGDVKAIRAVAKANGENCFAIIVPCHRVIAENGNLTGYAGGIDKKKWLLNFEKSNTTDTLQTTLFG
jgi:AraC family transcriptional regulator, regulatory protein of adaptative response / methylated-DNA-[protein]-cysteine methyltransferase